MIDYALLQRLCTANGISGDEDSVRELIIREIRDFADDITVDNLGNLLVKKKGRHAPVNKLMLSAHMDEVGLMVVDVTSDGYLKFDEVGGIDRRVVLGQRVVVGKNRIPGVIGIKPVHLTRGEESTAIPEYTEMYIDIGADSREDALNFVRFGDSVCFDSAFRENDYTICGKAIDDRFGCLVLIDLIKSDLAYDTDFAFVVQEEVGLRGAKTAAYTLQPDFALVVETTTAADIPEIDTNRQVCHLGEGAVISVMDRSTIYDKELVHVAMETASEIGVKAQYKRAVAGGNDAGIIHKSNGGVRTLAISLACRYLHAPSCVADKEDCESVLRLVQAMAERVAGGKL
ncbi:MAG: M42 family metallopeptidase [Ruminococcus sp.]|nr:M42 family metallopeptidase [Ruminococcus sp.]